MKSESGGQTHLATHRMGANLFDQVNDILLESVRTTPPGDFRRIKLLVDTGMIHLIHYQETKFLARLEEAISVTRQALTELNNFTIRLQPRDGAESVYYSNIRGVVLANLAIQLEQLFRGTARFPALEEAIKSTREAIDATSRHIQRYRLIYILGTQLQTRYATIGDRTDLEEAIGLNRETLTSQSHDRPFTRNRIAVLNNLASLLADRSAETGHDEDRETALELMKKARGIMKDAPDSAINSHACAVIWNNMSSIYTEKFLRNDHLEGLANAIKFSQKASEVALENSAERAMILSHYAVLRCMECEWLPRNFNNLMNSVSIAQQAATMIQALSGNASRGAVLYNLGNAHLYRYSKRREPQDLAEALSSIEGAVNDTLAVHTDLHTMFSHSRTRFGNRNCTMSFLNDNTENMSRPQWYFTISSQDPTQLGVATSSQMDRNDRYRSRKNNDSEITVPEEIVQEVVQAAAAYAKDGEKILKCRLKDYGPGVVTEKVLKTAVKKH